MEVEWGQLQLEQSTWAAPARVESIASQKLQMQAPRKEQIRFIRIGQVSDGTKAADVAVKSPVAGQTVQSGEAANSAVSAVSDRGGILRLWDKLKNRLNGAGQ